MQIWDDITGLFSSASDTANAAYNSAVSSLSQAMTAVGNQAQEWSMEWQAAVDNLKGKAAEFQRMFTALQNDAASVPPELKPKYDALMARGQWVKNQIQSITSGIDFGFNMFSSTPLMHGIKQIGGMNAMGILPLIPIAIITGGVAVIVAWLADAYTMQQKINLIKTTKANAGQAASILNSGSSIIGGGNFFQSAGVMLLIGVGVMLFWPTISATVNKALKK